ncbi:hypothetical protein SAMN02745121_03539 [Nannocystis exedens]|uniref:Uncharacterized protein n=1 Tax=Nannocystis exedens TaxID=54 RepID=A0A1I1YY62_9BACT|nr:hypothetical protein [Nannocystis exedens]PCC70140.1 hypothetical protein NAEX_03173 [Nannocystis exedens]SFE22970.1 hypothetical protein SAMN02745121_03539 [Nannocystis exedens]
MRVPIRAPVAVVFMLACGCSDGGGTTRGLTSGATETATLPTGSTSTGGAPTDPTTTGGTATSSTAEPASTSSSGASSEISSTTADSSSTTADPDCPPVQGEYNDCTDERGDLDNKACAWMGDGENGFITCLSAAGLMGASTCSLVNCELDCHCFAAPATGTAASVCRPNATDKGDSACVLDCSNGATCPDGMVCDNDTCFWPAA